MLQQRFTLYNQSICDLMACNVFLLTDEKVTGNGPIEQDKPVEEIRADPYSLPAGFAWDTLDIRDPLIVSRVASVIVFIYMFESCHGRKPLNASL